MGIATAALQKPETYVRLPETREGLVLEPAEVAGGFRVAEGSSKGLQIQDIGSQSIVPLLDLHPGQIFLDLCAAPGNKTAHALEFGVNAVACDFHLHRLRNVTGCARVVLDARGPLPFRRQFDRVLVDAPCSGTGTLSRNPEIKWRLTAGDIQALQSKQVEILSQAVTTLAPGGILVYSTCSLERQENEDVVQEVQERMGGRMKVLSTRQARELLVHQPGDGFFAAVTTVL